METSPDCRLIISELLGFRRLFLAIQVGFAQGIAPTEETIRNAIAEAERTKFEMADKRISGVRDLAKKQSATPGEKALHEGANATDVAAARADLSLAGNHP